jgi:hypothetical protein
MANAYSPKKPSYGVAIGLDPEWVQQAHDDGTSIQAAVLVVDCPTGAATRARFDITSKVLPLYDHPSPTPVRLSFGQVGARKTLVGCTASVDFILTVKDKDGHTSERSVQSPVYVDP